MPESRTYQGQTYTRNAPGEPWVLTPPQRGVVVADPYRAAEEARKAEDQEIQRAQLEVTQGNAAVTAQNAANTAAAERRAQLEWEATHFPDGTPKPKAAASAQANPDRIPQILTVLDNIKRIREMSDDTLAVGKWSERAGDWPLIGPWAGQNRANVEGALQMVQGDLIQQQIAILSEMNAGKGVASIANSETEAARMAASVANLDPNQELNEFQSGLDRAEQYYLRQLARLEGADTNDPEVRKFYDIREPGASAAPPNALTRLRVGKPMQSQTAGFGATEGQTITIPPELNAASDALVARLMQEGGGRIDPDAYASEFAKIAAQYPEIGISPEASAQWARDMNAYLDAGGKTIPGGVQIEDRPLSGVEQIRNSIVDNPVGSTVAGVANAGGFGLPSLLAGEGYDALRESRPVSQMVGEIGGGITGTALAGKALGMGAGMVGRESIAELLANPMTADMAYGAAYGATQGEDPLTGLAIGAGGSLLGSTAGTALGKTLPRATGVRPAADTLLPGERMVFDATNRTGRDEVAEALAQAANLGVPAGLADVSPDVNSLTGAAMRRSPTAAGPAAETLMARGRGQYDRLLGAVERDLGPIENIPQRSEDLITQARAQAGPLYEAAYAAPGAESVDLADLAERPTFEAALREAYQEVLDEGLDPSAIGLQQAGDNIMVASPSWQALDYVKRGLDNIIERNTSKIDGVSPEARRAIQMKNMLLARMDEANPDYAAARAAYAGPAQERAALQSGQEALRMSPNQLGVNMGNASPSQAAQMRLGFQSGLAEQAGRVRSSTNPFESTLGTPAMEQRLAAMGYGPDEVARLLSQRDLERQVAGSTNRLIGNSATAERQLADQAFGAESSLMGNIAQGAVETAITGAPVATTLRSGMGRGLGQSLRDWRTLGVGERARTAADQIIPLALDIDPENAARQLLELASRDEAYQVIVQELLDRAGRRGAIGGAGTSAAVAAELAR